MNPCNVLSAVCVKSARQMLTCPPVPSSYSVHHHGPLQTGEQQDCGQNAQIEGLMPNSEGKCLNEESSR